MGGRVGKGDDSYCVFCSIGEQRTGLEETLRHSMAFDSDDLVLRTPVLFQVVMKHR